MAAAGSRLETRLQRQIEGDVYFDRFSRGRYATDASIYQMMPQGVVVPKSTQDVEVALTIAREEGVPLLPRGGGTSQCGQTVNDAVVLDVSKNLDRLISVDVENRSAEVEPGIVLDRLNAALRPHGLWFPVDVSTSSRATIGGMAANNSCGSRSIRYGTMRDNVMAIDALLADGTKARFGEVARDLNGVNQPSRSGDLFRRLLDIGAREAEEIRVRFPDLMRRVGGYNIDALVPNGATNNLAHLLVGSEGTLAYSERVHLKLSPLPREKVLGVCHFPTFYEAMDAARFIVALEPTAVELVDRNMIALGREIPAFQSVVEQFVCGTPDSLLLVEFAEADPQENLRRLASLRDLMAERGFRWGDPGKKEGGVVEAIEPAFQSAIWEVRKQGLNIMMSMKGEGKPVSFIEDCAVTLDDLAEYTDRLTQVFRKHGTDGTWYAHASVGCLHVRPILNMKDGEDVGKMRAIAEEAFQMVRDYKGSHSGEHGDGIVRSEFHESMFGKRMVATFAEVKGLLDPHGRYNPGKIVDPPKMDDRRLFRYPPDYRSEEPTTLLDWAAWGGFAGAVEMCNNNGACRKRDAGVMCPSYRATGDEQHLTRGRANSLRLALSGQLGEGALTSDEMYETMRLCVSCKACKRECPTGVDMARMKTEFLHHFKVRHGFTFQDRLVGHLPDYAPLLSRLGPVADIREWLPGGRWLAKRILGLSDQRRMPGWRYDAFRETGVRGAAGGDREIVLFPDCFNRYFEPENLQAALGLFEAMNVRVHLPNSPSGRPLCCGRTFLAAGMVKRAKAEVLRALEALSAYIGRGVPVVGLEPSCLLTFRDEGPALLGQETTKEMASRTLLLEEFIGREDMRERLQPQLKPLPENRALLHAHCHQKAFGLAEEVAGVLEMIPDLEVRRLETGCCGMAGTFGYAADTYDVSKKIAGTELLPALSDAGTGDVVVAPGTSCRHQIRDFTSLSPAHPAKYLFQSLTSNSDLSHAHH